uniref:G_PROTEIN_RECEP_F1_2 domain-containing protein n=1 Tax=Panagrellus redivivus TaxID=6233 RepID=A0A7E4UPQ4_PANRE
MDAREALSILSAASPAPSCLLAFCVFYGPFLTTLNFYLPKKRDCAWCTLTLPITMPPNLSAMCLTPAQMEMAGSGFEKYLQRYLFPCLAIFGILGNALNLTVLLNRNMRSRANTFLATLAFADIVFLALLLPNILANYPFFTYDYYFRAFYFYTRVHLRSFGNWSSAVAIWCVIAVCTDRLIGIRHPLYIRSHVPGYKMKLVLGSIVLLPGLFTAYQHVEYKCRVRAYCQGTQLFSMCLQVNRPRWFGNQTNPYSEGFQQFVDVSILLNVILIIICPIILLTALNVLLLCALRQRSHNLLMKGGDELARPCVDSLKHHKTEQRVTLTVALIVTMFTVTNGPSAVVHLLQAVYESQQRDWYNVTFMCSTLVIFGKASNFILFCLCSKHFRNRLFSLAQKKVHEKLDTISTNVIDRRRSVHSMRKTSAPIMRLESATATASAPIIRREGMSCI